MTVTDAAHPPPTGGTDLLEMRTECEGCHRTLPAESGDATICSFECTWCTACTESTGRRCPNCSGELVARPRRRAG